MPKLTSLFAGAVVLGALGWATAAARADDGIFPPAPAAQPFVNFDGRGFLINGKRTFLTSGSLHYSRVPRALWRDRLLRMKRAGFNTVQTYVYWNVHEPQQGKFNFAGDADLDAFLKLVKQMGMYATVRPGPYVCAEWDSGGYPVWLRFVPGLQVRKPNAAFEKCLDSYFNKLMPIIAANQINRGGSVILVQLENEHPQGWGREMPNEYFTHLRDLALNNGIQVPYFFSGVHHGSDPAGDRPWDSKGRSNPWYTTEFWPGWYDLYGPLSPGNLRRFDRGTWKILAYGGNGYNYYMLYGGTNFDYFNNNEDASSYDYGGAIGQAGDLRPIYYRFKRAAMFAQSFAEILETSENTTDKYQGAATNPTVRVTARHSAAGDLLFLDNNTDAAVQTQVKAADGTLLPTAGPITLHAGEIMPIARDVPIFPGLKLTTGAARILGMVKQGSITTLVVYGSVGEAGELQFSSDAQLALPTNVAAWSHGANNEVMWKGTFADGEPQETQLRSGTQTLRVLAMSRTMADQTWSVEEGGQRYVICGAPYLSDVTLNNGRLSAVVESLASEVGSALNEALLPFLRPLVYSSASIPQVLGVPLPQGGMTAPRLGAWQMRRADAPSQPNFNDAGWYTSAMPAQMGMDGDVSAYAWYRTSLTPPQAGRYTLQFGGAGDNFIAFLDGKRVPVAQTHNAGLQLDLTAGKHSFAVFASHSGRDKLFGYLGPLDTVAAKGLSGPAALQQSAGNDVKITDWRMVKVGGTINRETPPATTAPGWTPIQIGQDAFDRQQGAAWFTTTLPALTAAHRVLHFDSTDEDATVYLNGQRLTQHEGWNIPFDVNLDGAWRADGPNVLTVLIENQSNTGGIDQPVTLYAVTYSAPVTGWKLRGGPTGGEPTPTTPQSNAGYTPLPNGATALGAPTWYRTTFNATPPAAVGAHPIWRVSMRGMSRGSVWLNGHNLGRYPEKLPVDGLYLPEPWLRSGQNTLLVFDEEGNTPQNVRLVVEMAASRVSGVATSLLRRN